MAGRACVAGGACVAGHAPPSRQRTERGQRTKIGDMTKNKEEEWTITSQLALNIAGIKAIVTTIIKMRWCNIAGRLCQSRNTIQIIYYIVVLYKLFTFPKQGREHP